MNSNINWQIPQRQSGSALFIAVVNALIGVVKFIWPLLALYLVRGKSNGLDWEEIVFLVLPLFTIINAVGAFLLFRFHVAQGSLIIRKGFLVKRNLTVPLEKIQAVHIDQGWLHQLFNVVKVSFDAAGTEKMEIRIMAIDRHRAEALRTFILGAATQPQQQETAVEKPLIQLTPYDIFKLSISANHIKAFFILAAFLVSTYREFIQIGGDDARGIWKQVKDFLRSDAGSAVIFLFSALLFLSLIISAVRVILKYYRFRITRSEKGYHIRSGLINLKEKLVPFNKIQYISWKANLVRQAMHISILQLHIAGANEEVEDIQEIKIPLPQSAYTEQITPMYHPLLPEAEFTAARVHASYIQRQTLLFGLLPAIAATGIGYIFWGAYAWLFLLLIPLTAFQSWLFQQKFRIWGNADALQLKQGVYGTEGIIWLWHKLQKVTVQQTIYQRRKKLATVKLYTAGGTISIPYIPEHIARKLCNYALYKVESSRRGWM
jgi:putative membrane protein